MQLKKRLTLLPLAFTLFAACSSAPVMQNEMTTSPSGQETAPAALETGFVSLFNGEDLTEHWDIVGNPEGWEVRDGVIHSPGGKGGNWIRSKKQYSDFVLKLEWKISKGGNSGVFIRCARTGRSSVTGMEAQITNAFRDDHHCTGSLYRYIPATPRPDNRADMWHTYEIRCEGPYITVKVDGVTTVDIDLREHDRIADKPLRGYIGLQDSHTGEGKWVEYRNIRIKEL